MCAHQRSQFRIGSENVFNEPFHYYTNPIECGPDHDKCVKSMPNVDEDKRDGTGEDLTSVGRSLGAQLSVDIPEIGILVS